MPTTRHYAVMISIIALLVIAIAAVAYLGIGNRFSQGAAVFEATQEGDDSQSAVVATTEAPNRESRLEALRNKIAQSGVVADTSSPTSEEPAPEDTSEPTDTPAAGTVADEENEQRCGNYHQGGAGWDSRGLLIDEVEGGRLIYREVPGDPLASTSEPVVNKDIVLQLPVRSVPSPTHSCIASDVIGIAKDGSLIRNTEVGVYRVFGQETLVGYALDGFPIYGASNITTDDCGGRMVAGQYRYQLSTNRERILNCFASSAVTI